MPLNKVFSLVLLLVSGFAQAAGKLDCGPGREVNTSLGDGVPNLEISAIGVIIGVDRIVDMCRTTVNVWGDAVGAKIITKIAPDEA